MSVNCLLFYGITGDQPVSSRMAGAARIATELRKNGYTVQIIDYKGLNTRDPIWQKIIKKFVGPETLWVGFSTTITGEILGIGHSPLLDYDSDPYRKRDDDNKVWINEFMDLVRQQNPRVEFIHGGHGNYDFRAYGWWKFSVGTDIEIVDFTKWLSNKDASPDFKHDNRYINSSGFKQFSTSQIDWLPQDIVIPTKTLPIEVSRGCIFRCKFCSFPYNGKKKLDYIKEAATLKEEFERNYERWGVTDYIFSDDTYNDSIEKMRLLHDEVFSKLSFKLGFSCYARLDLLEKQGEEGMRLFVDSGAETAYFGVESLNVKSLKAIGKSTEIQKLLEFSRRLKRFAPHLLLNGGFIVGLPGDNRKYIEDFETWLFSDDNPFDSWDIFALGIRPPHRVASKEFSSEIDINPESFGYKMLPGSKELLKNPYNKYRANWALGDIDFAYCDKKEEDIRNKSYESDRYRAGGMKYPLYLDLGFSKEQIRTQPMKNLIFPDELRDQRVRDYYNKILDL